MIDVIDRFADFMSAEMSDNDEVDIPYKNQNTVLEHLSMEAEMLWCGVA